MAERYRVQLYDVGHWLTEVNFKRRWQARLFHWLLSKSDDQEGVRDY